MNRRTIIILSVCLVAVLGYVLVRASNRPPEADDTEAVNAQEREDEARARERAAYERQTQARMAEISAMEARRSLKAKAAERSKEARYAMQHQVEGSWKTVINTNTQVFQELLRTAANSKSGTTHCTICDGVGLMTFCVLCGHGGKCLSCSGSGKMFGLELCPACLGTGKCHVCFGMGRMPCPFCEDGTISRNSRAPLNMPVR